MEPYHRLMQLIVGLDAKMQQLAERARGLFQIRRPTRSGPLWQAITQFMARLEFKAR